MRQSSQPGLGRYMSERKLLQAFLFALLFMSLLPIPSEESEKPSQSLTLTIGSRDETYIDCEIDLNISSFGNEYSHLAMVLPIPTERILQCPADVLCAWQARGRHTVFSIFVPANYDRIIFKVRSVPIIVSSTYLGARTLAINLSIGSDLPEIGWLKRQNFTIFRFDEIKVTFPFNINLASVLETPSHADTYGNTRVYTHDAIMGNNGVLSIHYPSSQDYWVIIAGFISACGVELIVAIMAFYFIEREKIERNIKAAYIVVVTLWFTTFALIPIWLICGSSYLIWIFPVNPVLPFLVPPTVSAIISTARVLTIVRNK